MTDLKNIDLHVHSCCSDGTDSPDRIVDMAMEKGLGAVALTDHDTVRGIPSFLARGKEYPDFFAIPGVEISSRYCSRELHILGLFVSYQSLRFNAFLEKLRQDRLERARVMAMKLATLGYPLDIDLLLEGPNGDAIGRPHFASMLKEYYDFQSVAEVFDKLLKRGAPAYVARQLPDPATVIEEIHAAGGVAIWAHPIYRESRERSWAKRVLRQLTPAGLDGIEAYYSSFSPDQTAILQKLAGEFHLVLTGGSDYHGSRHPDIHLGSGLGGLAVSADLLEPLIQRHKTIRTSQEMEMTHEECGV